jgi:hypothetical protein
LIFDFSISIATDKQVIRGDSDKLLFYFQGGGACFDQASIDNDLCTTDVSVQSQVGVFDRSNELNAFKSFTVVHVSYCSGDIFGGNVVRSYNDKNGQPIVQNGLANAQSALDWVKQQTVAGNFASTLSELVVMGCSAGSLGTQLWSKQVASSLSWKRAAIVLDSYVGVSPAGTTGPGLYSIGYCTSRFLSDELYAKCMNQELEWEDINLESMKAMQKLPFAFIQSKTDSVQRSYYDANKVIGPAEFYTEVNDIFGQYNTQPNFVSYLVNGDHHCFTNQDVYYAADATGPNGGSKYLRGKSTSDKKLHEWTSQWPLDEGVGADTQCDGDLQSKPTDLTYCDPKVVPKHYEQHY